MIDLEKMRELISDGIAGDKRWRDTEGEARSALEELISEVERLRGERPAVVAWLQAASQRDIDDPLNEAADAIERGEHRREEKE
jgi:hypothetical protein